MKYTSLTQVQADLRAERISCASLVQEYLENIKAQNDNLNAFLEVYDQEAQQQAQLVDHKIRQGTAGKLAGMVIGLKDVLCHDNHRLQAASKMLDGFVSQFNSTAVERLLQEDAIIIGRQNCDEFAMGSSNENSAFGTVKNAADITRVPGGSSGGSAVAVQANMCLASLGSDTGGSVRQPAAFCGIVGLKPTYGRISRHGLIAYASSFDQVGIVANSTEDCARILEVIAGTDEYDSTVSRQRVPQYSAQLNKVPSNLKIAYLENAINSAGISQAVKEQTEKQLNWLKEEGHTVEAVDFELLEYVLPTYYILTTAEASSNLSRFDGVRYGHRSHRADSLENLYKRSRSEGFGQEVKRRIMLGTFILSAGYYDAYYTKAQKVRRLIKQETNKLLNTYDFLLLPTTPSTAFKLGEHTKDPLEMYLADLFTVQASLCGLPAISVPNGQDTNSMPIGLQVVTKEFNEEKLLAFAQYLELAGTQ